MLGAVLFRMTSGGALWQRDSLKSELTAVLLVLDLRGFPTRTRRFDAPTSVHHYRHCPATDGVPTMPSPPTARQKPDLTNNMGLCQRNISLLRPPLWHSSISPQQHPATRTIMKRKNAPNRLQAVHFLHPPPVSEACRPTPVKKPRTPQIGPEVRTRQQKNC